MNEPQFETEESPGALVIRIRGDIGVGQAEELNRQFTRTMAHRGKFFVVDLSGVTYISSLGMGILMQFHKSVSLRGATTRWAALQPPVADAFKRARLDVVLKMVATIDDALKDAAPV